MAKININFDNTIYSIDESILADATDSLKEHLSTVMNGSGATINLDGSTYNIDSVKLSDATNDFVSHLGTIAGDGLKVAVNGVEYSIDSNKMSDVVSDLHIALDNLSKQEEEISFATSSWSKISEISQAGKASEYFALGDTRTVTFTYEDGTTEDIDFELVDFAYMADNANSSGRMAFLAKQCLKTPVIWDSTDTPSYSLSELNNYVGGTLVACLPSDLQEVMYKAFVPNVCTSASYAKKMYIPSYNMLFASSVSSGKLTRFVGTSTFPCSTKNGTAVQYWIVQQSTHRDYFHSITTKGKLTTSAFDYANKHYIRPIFFI